MNVQFIVSPNGDRLAILPEDEFNALVDAADDASDRQTMVRFRRELAAGREELVPAGVVARLLASENTVRVWREYRGLTVAALAEAAGLSQPYVTQIESGRRRGSSKTIAALAAVLGLAVDDLL